MKLPAGILVLIAIFAVIYATRQRLQSYIGSMSGTAPECLEMLGSTTSEDDGHTYIIGSLKNNCDHAFGSVTVLFTLDRTNGPMGDFPEGSAYAYGRDIQPGETWAFKSALPITTNSSYRFEGINAF
jgi:hypothetical protein